MSLININTAPKNAEEMTESLAAIRANLETSAKGAEQIERAAADIASLKESAKASEEAVRIAKSAEEIAKAVHESTRGGDDQNIAKQLRNLPRVHNVTKDEDFRGKAEANAFNVLLMSRSELRSYLSGEALQWALRFRKLNDMLVSAHTVMRVQNDARLEGYHRAGGMKSLPFYSAYEDTVKQGMRALDIQTATGIAEWIPTFYSADKFDDVKDRLEIASAFRFLPMPQSPWVAPTLLGQMTAYLVAESTSDTAGANVIPASDPTSGNFTLTAKKLALLSYWSREADQDSIVSILPMYDSETAFAVAYGIDNAVMNGQMTATIDTGDDPAVTNVRDGFNGLRYGAKLTGKQVDFSGTVTVESLAAMVGKAGKYAQLQNGRFFTGYSGLARLLVLKDSSGNVLNLTRDKAGADATLFGGAVGVLLGYPLSVGGVVPQNMNASGVIDAVTTTKTGMIFANTSMYVGGTRQAMQSEVSDHVRFAEDQRAVKVTARVAFSAITTPSSTKPFVVEGVNIPTY